MPARRACVCTGEGREALDRTSFVSQLCHQVHAILSHVPLAAKALGARTPSDQRGWGCDRGVTSLSIMAISELLRVLLLSRSYTWKADTGGKVKEGGNATLRAPTSNRVNLNG